MPFPPHRSQKFSTSSPGLLTAAILRIFASCRMKVILQFTTSRFYVIDKHLRIPIYEISIHSYSYKYVQYETSQTERRYTDSDV